MGHALRDPLIDLRIHPRRAPGSAYDPGMRTMGIAVAWLVACGGGADPAGDDAPALPDGPPPGTPLAERITVTTIEAPAGVKAGVSNWRIWGRQSLRVAPVFTVPLADCGTLVGFTTAAGGAPTARVARLDAADQLVTTYELGAYELRGLAAEPDGHFGALLWEDAADEIRVTRFDADGTNPRVSMLVDPIAVPDSFGIGESRLAYGDGRYGAYYHVHGVSGSFDGHEGDAFKWVDAATGAVTNRWSWGCSHSMSELLRHDPAAGQFLAACVTDCFPGTSGDFATNSIGGIYLDHNRSKVLDVNAGCNGSVAGELGGLTPSPSGWRLVFNAHQAPATRGQSSYSPSTMNQDIGFAAIGADGRITGTVQWLTTTPDDEGNASIARWQPADGTGEEYVVGWAELTMPRAYKLARVSAAGALLEPPIDVTGRVAWGERDDPFREHHNHDVVWAWFEAAGATTFRLARIRSSRACEAR